MEKIKNLEKNLAQHAKMKELDDEKFENLHN